MFWSRQYDLVLVDVEGETGIHDAEHVCSEIKTAQPSSATGASPFLPTVPTRSFVLSSIQPPSPRAYATSSHPTPESDYCWGAGIIRLSGPTIIFGAVVVVVVPLG
jgi:hypothetical protein